MTLINEMSVKEIHAGGKAAVLKALDEYYALITGETPTPVVVFVVRDSDSANEITVYGTDGKVIKDDAVVVYDVDLGYADLSDRDEYLEWADGEYSGIKCLPENHPARKSALDLVLRYGGPHRLTSHDAIKAAVGSI